MPLLNAPQVPVSPASAHPFEAYSLTGALFWSVSMG
jgi:hypothetical protein